MGFMFSKSAAPVVIVRIEIYGREMMGKASALRFLSTSPLAIDYSYCHGLQFAVDLMKKWQKQHGYPAGLPRRWVHSFIKLNF